MLVLVVLPAVVFRLIGGVLLVNFVHGSTGDERRSRPRHRAKGGDFDRTEEMCGNERCGVALFHGLWGEYSHDALDEFRNSSTLRND